MAERNAKLILMVGVLGVSASAILVRFSQAPSGVTAAYRLGWTVLLLLPVVLLRCRAELRRVTARGFGPVRGQRRSACTPLPHMV